MVREYEEEPEEEEEPEWEEEDSRPRGMSRVWRVAIVVVVLLVIISFITADLCLPQRVG